MFAFKNEKSLTVAPALQYHLLTCVTMDVLDFKISLYDWHQNKEMSQVEFQLIRV